MIPSFPVVEARNITVNYQGDDGELMVLRNVSFDIFDRQFVCLLGTSGSGKTTLLKVLAGLIRPTEGSVKIVSRRKDSPHPDISLVFQHANLMPWRNVIENITLPLELQNVSKGERETVAMEWINLIGLEGFENSWPRELSGGMAQRVAIARSLIQDPDLMLLDEPFGLLDAFTREKMGTELLNLWQNRQKTVLMVTHSISEALLLADRILVLSTRSGNINLDISVPFPRPRTDEIRFTPEFNALSKELRSAIV